MEPRTTARRSSTEPLEREFPSDAGLGPLVWLTAAVLVATGAASGSTLAILTGLILAIAMATLAMRRQARLRAWQTRAEELARLTHPAAGSPSAGNVRSIDAYRRRLPG